MRSMLVLILLTISRDLEGKGRIIKYVKEGREHSPVPKFLLRLLDQERLQGVTYFIAHVRVRQIQARQNRCLQFLLARFLAVDQITNQHVQEHNIGRVDEGNILKRWKRNLINFISFSIFSHSDASIGSVTWSVS